MGDDEGEGFRPPNIVEAMRSMLPSRRSRELSRPTRPRAQPAAGSAEEAELVNYVNRRERMVGLVLGAAEIVWGIAAYIADHHYVEHTSKTISVATAHATSLAIQREAPWTLAVNLVLGFAILGTVAWKRRAAVGFTVLLAGVGLLGTGGGFLGIIYLAAGLWLVMRAMRRPTRSGLGVARGGRSRPAGGESASGGTTAAARSGASASVNGTTSAPRALTTTQHKVPKPSSRYTPPRKRFSSQPKHPVGAEPERESRLVSWLRR